jgi:DNA repair exonuclease SbcCD ATPase subunit
LEHELKVTSLGHENTCKELEASRKSVDGLNEEKTKLAVQGARWKREGDELRAEIAALRREHENAGQERITGLQRQIEILMIENEELKSQLPELETLRQQVSKLEAELKRLLESRQSLQGDLKAVEDKRKADQDEVSGLKKELKQAKEEVSRGQGELAGMTRQLDRTSTKLSESEKACDLASNQLQSKEQERKLLDLANNRLTKELEECEASKKAMLDKANKALEKLKSQVLQMTCQGLLRLCVVAPRVTIAFEMKNINVSALLPSLEIHAMLEKELLPKYTKVFMQPGENLGPEGEEMEKWLQGLLKDMETKIEQKLVSVLNENVPQGSVVASSNGRKK